ncbi:MAG: hypothetical protein AAGH74_06190 [Pseudomonadota bacterium]
MANEPKDEKDQAAPTELTDESLEDAQGGLSMSFRRVQKTQLKVPTGGFAETDMMSTKLNVKTLSGAGETPPLKTDLGTKKV